MLFDQDAIARLSPAVREEIQEHYLRSYLARARRQEWLIERQRIIDEAIADAAEQAAIQAELKKPWSNGPCCYCGRDDGFTEVRSIGPVHLQRCFAAYTTVQRRKARCGS